MTRTKEGVPMGRRRRGKGPARDSLVIRFQEGSHAGSSKKKGTLRERLAQEVGEVYTPKGGGGGIAKVEQKGDCFRKKRSNRKKK